jgi:thioesterase domain-containing protein
MGVAAAEGRGEQLPGAGDTYELGLRAIWRRILDLPNVGRREDFFGLGGDSMAAAHMFAQVEATFGVRLTPAAFYGDPTIAGLAAVLRKEADAGRVSTVVPLKPSGSRLPLFFVLAGGPWLLADLARHIAPDQPLYGVHCLAIVDPEAPQIDFEEQVAHYVESVRAVQPSGPYILGGVSAGGRVAYEMAQRMMAEGDEVALVALVDTMCRRTLISTYWGFNPRVLRALRFLGRLSGRAPARRSRALTRVTPGQAQDVRELPAPDDGAAAMARAHLQSIRRHVHKLVAAHRRSARHYRPGPTEAPVAFFWSEATRVLSLGDPRRGWAKLARGGFEVHRVPGNHHESLLEPYVATLAGKLEECLRRAQESVSAPD